MAAILSTSFAVAVTDWAATWQLASVTGVAIGHLCVAESEVAQVTRVGPATTVTVRRGVEATSAAAHAAGTPVAVYRADDVRTSGGSLAATAPPLRQATLTLNQAQILALKVTPQVILAAPGATRVAVPVGVTLLADFVTGYTGDADFDALVVAYAAGGGAAQVASLFNGSGASENYFHRWLTNADGRPHLTHLLIPQSAWVVGWGENIPVNMRARALAEVVNQAITLAAVIAGTLTGGASANTLSLSVRYGLLDVTTGVWV